jgi:hypothetical protein
MISWLVYQIKNDYHVWRFIKLDFGMLSIHQDHAPALDALESGQLLFLGERPFVLKATEVHLLNPRYLAPKSKNIGYHAHTQRLWGAAGTAEDLQLLQGLIHRFAEFSQALMQELFPSYTAHLQMGRTSFRPAAVSNRRTSYRKDDRLLHVDAFPATPNQGRRILRVFSNVNPQGEPRIWNIGQPFAAVADYFLPTIKAPWPGKHHLMHGLKLTKSRRSLYDHYMLYLHDKMKADSEYQQQAISQRLELPAGSTWVVATDQVSHAALSGQYLLEQTFYLPVEAMQHPEQSPLRVLEKKLGMRMNA